MNFDPHPEREYLALIDFYQSGGDLDYMPEEFRRREEIYRFCAPQVERGYVDARTIGRMVFAEFGKKYNLTSKTCYNHALNAIRYYRESIIEDTALIRARLTKLLFKMIDYHYEFLLQSNPMQGQKAIDMCVGRLMELNPSLKKGESDTEEVRGETVFVVSDNAKDFPELNQIPETRLLELVQSWEKTHALTESEKEELIRKDIGGAII